MNFGMLVKGKEHMRSKVRELGGKSLPNTQDWFILPPKYEDVVGEIMRDSVQKFAVDNDPHVKILMNESLYDARVAVMEAKHLAELRESQALADVRKVELEKKDFEIRAIRAEMELERIRLKQ